MLKLRQKVIMNQLSHNPRVSLAAAPSDNVHNSSLFTSIDRHQRYTISLANVTAY